MGERRLKVRVGLIFGGRSAEHEISIRSARSVFAAIDRRLFEPVLIGIDVEGGWHLLEEERLRHLDCLRAGEGAREIEPMFLRSAAGREDPSRGCAVDVVFPVLHGAYGEDGTIQGLLETLDLPYVGAGVLGSALGMDKDVQKRLLQAAGVPVVPFRAVRQEEWERAAEVVRRDAEGLGVPLFVKPANLGSSVGVHKVTSPGDLEAAIADALGYDTKILLECGIAGREIECSVLGNDDPQASSPGEIIAAADFYSYEAKYGPDSEAQLLIPAPLSAELTTAVQRLAVRTFQVLECSGMARVDFFLQHGTERLFVNELNTIPGFTPSSMYPRLWEASGLPYSQLITRLIDLAFERHAARECLRRPARAGR